MLRRIAIYHSLNDAIGDVFIGGDNEEVLVKSSGQLVDTSGRLYILDELPHYTGSIRSSRMNLNDDEVSASDRVPFVLVRLNNL